MKRIEVIKESASQKGGGSKMKKKFALFSITILYFLLGVPVSALSVAEIKARTNICPADRPVELAYAKADGGLENRACYGTYQEAKSEMDRATDANADNLVIIEDGMIIDAKYALVDYDQNTDKKYTDVYSDKTLKTATNYIKVTASSADDAVLLEVDYATKRIKIKVNDMIGWIKKYEYESSRANILYDIVPVIWAKEVSRYEVTDTESRKEIIHILPQNISGTKLQKTRRAIGPKPDMLGAGTYYSYDGHYFYTDLKTMIRDYKNNTYASSVNSTNPYYNYYQYISFRTKTSYNAANINQFIRTNASSTSKLYNTGESFIKYQNAYGINAALMLSIGINESAWGKSTIAQNKNNLFGLNAVDKDPELEANQFRTVDDCINDYAYAWLSYGYVQPGDFRFRGANLGTKGEGLNVKYASDTYWGEIAASLYYQLDKTYGLQDYKAYEIAVLKDNYTNTVYATKTPGGERVSTSFYQYQIKSSPVVILEEVAGPAVEGNTTWYKIMSDPTLDANKNYIGDSKTVPRINYIEEQNQVYVPAAYFIKPNQPGNYDPGTPEQPVTPGVSIDTIIQTAGINKLDGGLLQIGIGEAVTTIQARLSNNNAQVQILESNGTGASGTMKTNQRIIITSGTVSETYTVVVFGDTNGDGNISAVDYVKIKNNIMGTDKLAGASLRAADVNKDGNISAVDYVKVKNYIMGDRNAI